MSVIDVFRQIPLDGFDGIWTDDGCIDERQDRQPEAEAISEAIRDCGWDGSYFGGVAFKYQRKVEDLASAAKIAAKYMDVVCTSGPGTGQAAAVEKLRAMKARAHRRRKQCQYEIGDDRCPQCSIDPYCRLADFPIRYG